VSRQVAEYGILVSPDEHGECPVISGSRSSQQLVILQL